MLTGHCGGSSSVSQSRVQVSRIVVWFLALFVGSLALLVPTLPQGVSTDQRVSVFVHLDPHGQRDAVRTFAAQEGGIVRYEYHILPNMINVRQIPVRALPSLRQIPGVRRMEIDRQLRAHLNDSTPLIRALQSQLTAAGLSVTGSGVRVCVIDTGIDADHSMYATRIDSAAGFDFVNGDPDPQDDNGHGAQVAGIILGSTGLTVDFGGGPEPFQGVAPQATLIGVKALNAFGTGLASDVIAGIDHCAAENLANGRADIINLSLGGGEFAVTCDADIVAAAANNAVDLGIVVVASAGNESFADALASPACGSKVIAVGATYDADFPNVFFPSLDSFSFSTCTDTKPTVDQIACFSNNSTNLDVVGPGCRLFSADSSNSPSGIIALCGTSQAAPHVAGLAALILDADPTLTPVAVRQLIRNGGVDFGTVGFDPVYGNGRIDVLNSLQLLAPCGADSDCDDGLFCNGIETCDLATGQCIAGASPCDDSDPCTVDCDETNDFCVSVVAADSESAAGLDGVCDTIDDNLTLFGGDGICDTLDDSSGDGVCDAIDGCRYLYDPDQEDADSDTVGDVCDPSPFGPQDVTIQSSKTFVGGGATTFHFLPIAVEPAVGGDIEVDAFGDFAQSDETATARAEGKLLGSITAAIDCSTSTPAQGVFPVTRDELRVLTADDLVQVEVENSAAVSSAICAMSLHRVRLNYRRAPIVSMPKDAGGIPGTSVVVPVNLSDVTGLAVVSADVTIRYNKAVLQAADVTTGSVTADPQFKHDFNLANPGLVVLSVFATPDPISGTVSPIVGSGSVAEITFDVLPGTLVQGSPLHIESALLNEGDPSVIVGSGQFATTADISGTVLYYRDLNGTEPSLTKGVPGAVLSLEGAGFGAPDSTVTDGNGNYVFNKPVPQSYTVSPSKLGDLQSGVTSFDAALNAQHVVGLDVVLGTPLTPNQLLAADCSGDGFSTGFDSSLIAQVAVGVVPQCDVAARLASDWCFLPDPAPEPNQSASDCSPPIQGSISYGPLIEPAENQNFVAILFGDVSGNWPTELDPAVSSASVGLSVPTSRQRLKGESQGRLKVSNVTAAAGESIRLAIMAQAVDEAVAFDLDLRFDPAVIRPLSVEKGEIASTFTLISNLQQAGRVRIGMFDTDSLGAEGEVVAIFFEVVGRPGDHSTLTLTGLVNEGRIPAIVKEGFVRVRPGR